MTSERVERTFIFLTILQTLAASLIWGINTLFLLDAGLSLTEAFIANGAFTAGMMIFEIPTGAIADTLGRRASYLMGATTLMATTLAYLALWHWGAGIGWWILVSALIGLGFTFFSGATQAWLVDALNATGHDDSLESVFGKGQVAAGAATLAGAIAGGFLAQVSFALPYLLRSAILIAVIAAAYVGMHDLGFTPHRARSIRAEVRDVLHASLDHGWRNPPIRMFMLAAPLAGGVWLWAFYAFQPYILELFGRPDAVYLAGLAAAIFALAQMAGGYLVNHARRVFRSRSLVIILSLAAGAVAMVLIGLASQVPQPTGFWVAVFLLAVAATLYSLSEPMQQAYMNDVIPSEQRATVLSFANLMGSAGGVVIQPVLGRVADVYSLGVGYVMSGMLLLLNTPFILWVRQMGLDADRITPPKQRTAE